MLERLGKYEILETVAAGGQGTVNLAQDIVLDCVVAVKIISPSPTIPTETTTLPGTLLGNNSRLEHPCRRPSAHRYRSVICAS